MKTLLILTLATLSLFAQSQTITVPRETYKSILKAAEDGVSYRSERDSCLVLSLGQEREIARKETVIVNSLQSIKTLKAESLTLNQMLQNQKQQLNEKDLAVQFYKKKYNGQKRKALVTGIIGILTTSAMAFIAVSH